MAQSPKKNSNERIYRMVFGSVYPLYIQKAEKKGRTAKEVDEIITWLTGYDKKAIEKSVKGGTDFRTFFEEAPKWNPNASKIYGNDMRI